ncbi:hypothetical protein NPIL_492541 [Nephila pilipes]|uniref:Uncharacterized protein n=1 Tax=Nephila pilipes TaxID=299642 RepID=A0A8X6U1V5_NEPPI|nr:hypothetical protein NPIL_492541 [Nephila pilipes]
MERYTIELRVFNVEQYFKTNESLMATVRNWINRGYIMSQEVSYRYAPDSDSEEAQLVIPFQKRERILKKCCDIHLLDIMVQKAIFTKKNASRYYLFII